MDDGSKFMQKKLYMNERKEKKSLGRIPESKIRIETNKQTNIFNTITDKCISNHHIDKTTTTHHRDTNSYKQTTNKKDRGM